MSVVLRNTGTRPIVATLYHDVACAHDDVCHCTHVQRVGRDGKPDVVRIPRTIRIDGGKTVEVVASALLVPTVSAALREGHLVKVDSPRTKRAGDSDSSVAAPTAEVVTEKPSKPAKKGQR